MECACFLTSVSQIIADSQHFIGRFAPVMYEGFHPLYIHPSGARMCQALCFMLVLETQHGSCSRQGPQLVFTTDHAQLRT